jgi:hypothetical protein
LRAIRHRDFTALTHDTPESIAQCKADRHALLVALDVAIAELGARKGT